MFASVGFSFDQIKNYLGSSAIIGQGIALGRKKEKNNLGLELKCNFLLFIIIN